MFECLKKSPKTIYHFTKRENVEKIKNDRKLKKFGDSYVFACESYEDCIFIMRHTVLNPKAHYIDYDGNKKKYSDTNPSNYVVLKLKVKYDEPFKWFQSGACSSKEINDRALAYSGNLSIDYMDQFEVNL